MVMRCLEVLDSERKGECVLLKEESFIYGFARLIRPLHFDAPYLAIKEGYTEWQCMHITLTRCALGCNLHIAPR